MGHDVKKLQERIPFDKAASIEKSMLAKHGPDQTYGPGTFGVEFEAAVPAAEASEMDDMISAADPDDIAHIINRHATNQGQQSFQSDYEDWLMDVRKDDNKYRRSWDDSHGPIDVDTWLEDNPEPERRDYDEDSDYDSVKLEWDNAKDAVDGDYRYWKRRGLNDYHSEFVEYRIHTFGSGVYEYIDRETLFDKLFPEADSSNANRTDLIETVRAWLIDKGEKVSDDEQGHENEWGVGEDGSYMEIRTKHMRNADVDTLVDLMNWMRRNHLNVSGGTSAHVHVGLPADFDYFDLLVTVTLVDEDKVKTDAGPDREFREWARLRDQILPYVLLQARRWMPAGENSITLSEQKMGDFLRQTFQKFQGTNISSYFEHKTVEFRYFSSKMIANPALFVQWIKYFMLLPSVAKKRSRATFIHPDNSGMKLFAVRQRNGSVTLSFDHVADTDEKPSDLKGGRVTPKYDAFDTTTFDPKEEALKKHIDRLTQKLNANTITTREAELLPRLQSAWQTILDKKHVKI